MMPVFFVNESKFSKAAVVVYLRFSKAVETPDQLQHGPNAHPKNQEAAGGHSAPTPLRRNPRLLQAPTWTDWWEKTNKQWIKHLNTKSSPYSGLFISLKILIMKGLKQNSKVSVQSTKTSWKRLKLTGAQGNGCWWIITVLMRLSWLFYI